MSIKYLTQDEANKKFGDYILCKFSNIVFRGYARRETGPDAAIDITVEMSVNTQNFIDFPDVISFKDVYFFHSLDVKEVFVVIDHTVIFGIVSE